MSILTNRQAPLPPPAMAGEPSPVDSGRPPTRAASGSAWLGAGSIAVSLIIGSPLLLLTGLLLSTGSWLARWMPMCAAVPSALLVLVGTSIAIGTLAAAFAVDVTTTPWLLDVAYLGVALGALITASRPSQQRRPLSTRHGSPWIWLPPGVAVFVAFVQGVGDRAAAWTLMGTDIAEHVVMLGDVQRAGALTYVGSGYPRALQMLLSLVSIDRPGVRSAELLTYDLKLYAGTLWLLFAVLLVAAGALTYQLATLRGLSHRASAVAGTLVGLALLSAEWVHATFIRMGSGPVFIAVLAIWSLPALAMSGRNRRPVPGRFILLGAASVALVSHLWQGLMIVPIISVASYLVTREARTGLRRMTRHTPRAWVAAIAGILGILVCGVVAWIPVQSLMHESSFSAGAAGSLVGPPLLLLMSSVAVIVGYLRTGPAGLRATSFGAAAGCLLLAGALLVGSGSPDLAQYYPRKALSTFVLAAAPWLGAALASAAVGIPRLLHRALGRRLDHPRLLDWGCRTVGCVLLVAAIAPGLARSGSLLRGNVTGEISQGGVGSRRLALGIELAREHPHEVIVPSALGTSGSGPFPGAFVIAKLLRFQTGQITNPGYPYYVCEDVANVAGSRKAVVVTDLPADVLRRRMTTMGCGDIPVIHVDGGDAHIIQVMTDELQSLPATNSKGLSK